MSISVLRSLKLKSSPQCYSQGWSHLVVMNKSDISLYFLTFSPSSSILKWFRRCRKRKILLLLPKEKMEMHNRAFEWQWSIDYPNFVAAHGGKISKIYHQCLMFSSFLSSSFFSHLHLCKMWTLAWCLFTSSVYKCKCTIQRAKQWRIRLRESIAMPTMQNVGQDGILDTNCFREAWTSLLCIYTHI